jgi:hypothetical protein
MNLSKTEAGAEMILPFLIPIQQIGVYLFGQNLLTLAMLLEYRQIQNYRYTNHSSIVNQ